MQGRLGPSVYQCIRLVLTFHSPFVGSMQLQIRAPINKRRIHGLPSILHCGMSGFWKSDSLAARLCLKARLLLASNTNSAHRSEAAWTGSKIFRH